ncbi:MAG: hypothetical protein JKY00_00995 [Roseicyclus sp.]|nr:hypothetical protein [Roseicyclus sp.]
MGYSVFVDIAAALAVTALLAESYGVMRRKFVGAALAPIVLGVLFGLMALVQMHRPLEPFDGFIIDLRNIPIALSGAFLGWRGLVPCLVIALATGYGIGGVGATSGMWGMVLAGLAGMIWARKTAHLEERNFSVLMLLAIAMSAHLLAGLALPNDIAVWFFTTAAGPILAMNLIAIPLIGALLERENRRILQENHMAAAITRDPATGLLTGPAFVRELMNAYAARSFGTYAGFLSIKLESAFWPSVFGRVRKSVNPVVDRELLSAHLEYSELAGSCADGRILIPISKNELDHINRIKSDLRQALTSAKAGAAYDGLIHLTVIDATDPAEFQRVTETAALETQPDWRRRSARVRFSFKPPGEMSFVQRARLFNPDVHDVLFAKAEFLICRSRSRSRSRT